MANKYNKPRIDEEKLGKNPLILNLKIVVNTVPVAGMWKVEDGITLPADMEIEKASFTKVFNDADRRKELARLSNRAVDLFLWLIFEVEPNQDWLWVNRVRYMEERQIKTYNTYNGAVNELIGLLYIAKVAGYPNVFWINPHYFFNGNRAKCFPKNVVKK